MLHGQREFKVIVGMKVANQPILKQGDYSGFPWVGPNSSQGPLNMEEGGRRASVRVRGNEEENLSSLA